MEGTAEPYIYFDNVEVQYSELVYGLRGINMRIEKGEFVFLCGRTGSGKSTLIRLLSAEVRARKGRVMFDGQDLTTMPRSLVPMHRRKIGIVPQDFGLLPGKRVWENVGYAMRAIGRTKAEIRRHVPEILERVNILHRADAFPSELSGGEQQRVAIGRALINNPALLLADEPTGNLDPQHSTEIMQLLAGLNLRGTTVVVASHDMAVVSQMDKRIVRLEGGRITEEANA